VRRIADGAKRLPLASRGRHTPAVPLAHIAILDDEPDITTLLGTYLSSHGYRVSALHRGAALFELLQRDPPALVLLDLGLPGEDGLAIARQLREFSAARGGAGAPGLVIVSGRGDSVDKVVGLEIGADDYITKPFDLRELLARVKAVLRRTSVEAAPIPAPAPAAAAREPATTQQFCGFTLDLAARRLLDPTGCEVALTAGEFDLLAVFVRHPGRVLSRDFLLEQTRGREAAPFDRSVDVLIGRLRKKLADDLQQPQILKAVRSAGYLLVMTPGPRSI
jgi:DNA-binding response OmpR family regulator